MLNYSPENQATLLLICKDCKLSFLVVVVAIVKDTKIIRHEDKRTTTIGSERIIYRDSVTINGNNLRMLWIFPLAYPTCYFQQTSCTRRFPPSKGIKRGFLSNCQKYTCMSQITLGSFFPIKVAFTLVERCCLLAQCKAQCA